MKKRHLFFVMLPLAAFVLGACSDELEGSKRYDDGFLHFNLQFNDQKSQWKENGNGSQTRMDAPLKLTSKDVEGLTLYLHAEESDIIETPQTAEVTTRGQRYTGEVFDGGIDNLSLYGIVGTKPAFGGNFQHFTIGGSDKNFVGPVPNPEKEFYVSEQEFNFYWGDNEVGNFYGYAPADVPGITSSVVSGNPILRYNMPENEKDQKDVLAAKQVGVSRAKKNEDGIELQFQHVLSAVKFKINGTDGSDNVFKATVHDKTYPDDPNYDKTYYLKVKGIQVKGVYSTGTMYYEDYTGPSDIPGNIKIMEGLGYWQGSTDVADIADCMVDIEDPQYTKTNTLLNTDEQCLMMLPQTTPEDAKVVLLCDMSTDGTDANVEATDVTFEASLGNLNWEPGHSYTYKLSDSDLVHVLIISGEAFPGNFSIYGASKEFKVRSFYTTPREDNDYSAVTAGIPAPWKPEYKEGSDPWTDGMPMGYEITDAQGDRIEDLNSIPGSVLGETYKLEASIRLENSPTVSALRDDGRSKVNYDLSTNGGTTPMNTANCYVVTGYGTYKLPIVYGNAIKDGLTNYAAFTEADQYEVFVNYEGNHITEPWVADDTGDTPGSASIVWEDEKNLFSNVKLSEDKKYLCFEIQKRDIKNGNAILAVKNSSGTIMWSWHIWVTNEGLDDTVTASDNNGHTLQFLKRSLGWRLPEVIPYTSAREFTMRIKSTESTAQSEEKTVSQDPGTVYISGSNVYYQFGRKDPSPGTILKYSDNNTTGVEYDMTNDIIANGYDWSVETTARAAGFEEGIKHPNVFYALEAGLNWMATDYDNIRYGGGWDVLKPVGIGHTTSNGVDYYIIDVPSGYSITKTVNDPCPVGFTVAPRNGFEILKSWTQTHLKPEDTPTRLNGFRYTNGTQTIDFFMTGNRSWHWHVITGTNPVQKTNLEYFNQQGRFWTAGHRSDDFGHYFRITGTNTTTTDGRYRSRGMSVVPVGDTKLNEIAESFTLPFSSPKFFVKGTTAEGAKAGKNVAQYYNNVFFNRDDAILEVDFNYTSYATDNYLNALKIELESGSTVFATITRSDCNITTNNQQHVKVSIPITNAIRTSFSTTLNSSSYDNLFHVKTATYATVNSVTVKFGTPFSTHNDETLDQNKSLSRRKNY